MVLLTVNESIAEQDTNIVRWVLPDVDERRVERMREGTL
jgi:hypothetical protein